VSTSAAAAAAGDQIMSAPINRPYKTP